MKHFRHFVWPSLIIFVFGCQTDRPPPVVENANADPWVLTLTDPNEPTPAFVGNGDLGIRIGRDGTTNGVKPSTFSFPGVDMEGTYYQSPIDIKVNGQQLEVLRAKNYHQFLNMKTGVLITSWQQIVGSSIIEFVTRVFTNAPTNPIIKITSSQDADFEYSENGMFPKHIELLQNQPKEIQLGYYLNKRIEPVNLDWSTDILIEGSPEDQQAVRSFIFYLAHMNSGTHPVTPFGVSSTKYNSRVFWDSDLWIAPALALIAPEKVKALSRFRIDTMPNGGYYWETNLDGTDGTTGMMSREIHISGDVAKSLDMMSNLGIVSQEDSQKVGKHVANYYLNRLTKDGSGVFHSNDIVSVDEWIEGDDCLYTNAIAEWTIEKFLGLNVKVALPHDDRGLLAYKGDKRMAYKQAAAALVLWPLERDDIVPHPIKFIELFEGKESDAGPAMTQSVYALIRARYGNADEAYETWRKSWMDYTDSNPFLLFSEKKDRRDATYFNTGAAGCLNAVIYGFLGARIVDTPNNNDIRIKIQNGKWLVFRPNLPSTWKSVTFKNMQVGVAKYDVVCRGRMATITLGDQTSAQQ